MRKDGSPLLFRLLSERADAVASPLGSCKRKAAAEDWRRLELLAALTSVAEISVGRPNSPGEEGDR